MQHELFINLTPKKQLKQKLVIMKVQKRYTSKNNLQHKKIEMKKIVLKKSTPFEVRNFYYHFYQLKIKHIKKLTN